jgi:hypothetical protein
VQCLQRARIECPSENRRTRYGQVGRSAHRAQAFQIRHGLRFAVWNVSTMDLTRCTIPSQIREGKQRHQSWHWLDLFQSELAESFFPLFHDGGGTLAVHESETAH